MVANNVVSKVALLKDHEEMYVISLASSDLLCTNSMLIRITRIIQSFYTVRKYRVKDGKRVAA